MRCMFGLDDWIAGLGASSPLVFATVIAALLGLRHATDPDHLTALTTLLASGRDPRGRTAARLGAVWGAGHALTLFVFGLPIVIASRFLPPRAQELAEAGVGVMICVLAIRLLWRWRQGAFHTHEHDHGDGRHRHLHPHGRPARSSRTAFGIGLVHGIGGSAGIGVLLIASLDATRLAVVALGVLAVGTAISMALCSALLGLLLTRPARGRSLRRSVPALGSASLAFGVWYVAAAFALVPYPF